MSLRMYIKLRNGFRTARACPSLAVIVKILLFGGRRIVGVDVCHKRLHGVPFLLNGQKSDVELLGTVLGPVARLLASETEFDGPRAGTSAGINVHRNPCR